MSMESKIRTQITKQLSQQIPLSELTLDINFRSVEEQQYADTVLIQLLNSRCPLPICEPRESHSIAA